MKGLRISYATRSKYTVLADMVYGTVFAYGTYNGKPVPWMVLDQTKIAAPSLSQSTKVAVVNLNSGDCGWLSKDESYEVITDAIDATRFFSTPGLWIGIVVAAAFIWLAIQLRRRYSET